MQQKSLGNTGLFVSPIGLGTVKFARNQGVKYPHAFAIPTDQEVLTLLRCAQELGITLLDTAPAYGNSEERLGKLLGKTRKEWVIVTKVGEEFMNGVSSYDFTPEHLRFSVERSLQRLKTDYLDVVLVHSDGNDLDIINRRGLFTCLSDIKQQGLIRAFGMSTKTLEGGLLTVELADVVMVTYNPLQTAEKPVIAKAFQEHKGVLIKKALASGHVNTLPGQNPVQTAFEFVLKEPGVSSIIVGTLNPHHLRQNASFIPQ
jgi:aryl-alcohol dehydrogenase-like predicted oxidoreductase